MNIKSIQSLGLGLRFEHMDDVINLKPSIPWFEVILEDFLGDGPHHAKLEIIRQNYPIVFHSVSLNLGGVDRYDDTYLQAVKSLYQKFDPDFISDHLCWSSFNGKFHHDLLPIPKTKEGMENIISRIHFLQDFFAEK